MSKRRLNRQQVETWIFLLLAIGVIGLATFVMLWLWP